MARRTAKAEGTDTRGRLLEAAQEAFADRGFAGASIREICAAAGANVAAVKYHFGGKEGLYIEAVKAAHLCAGRMDTAQAPAGVPPVEMLKGFIRELVARMHTPASPAAMKLMMREMADPGKAANVVVTEFIQPAAFVLWGILRELLPGLDERRLLATGFSVMGQVLYYRQNRPVSELIFGKAAIDALDVESVTEHVTRFTLAALGYAGPIGPPAARRGKAGRGRTRAGR